MEDLSSSEALLSDGECICRLELELLRSLRRNCCLLWFLVALLFLSLAVCVFGEWFLPRLVQKKLRDNAVVDSMEAEGFRSWEGNARPGDPEVHFDLYVWDLQNPKEVAAYGHQPILIKKGPYAFKEYRKRFNVSFLEDGNVVAFYEQQYFVFDEERTAPGLGVDDTFTTVNLALQGMWSNEQLSGVSEKLGKWFKKDIMKGLMCKSWEEKLPGYSESVQYTPFVEAPVIGYLFGFRDEPLLVKLQGWLDSHIPKFIMTPPSINTNFPGMGVLNYSDEADTIRRTNINYMFTGKNDTSMIGHYIKWRNMSSVYVCSDPPVNHSSNLLPACPNFQHEWTDEQAKSNGWLPLWGSSEANQVKGTDLLHWALNNASEKLVAFVDNIYRWAYVEDIWGEARKSPDVYGVPVRKYGLRNADLLNSTNNPENTAYYAFGPNGLMNLSRVASNHLPFFISKAHFLDADPALLDAVYGLSPNKEEHDTYLLINEMSGATVGVKQGLQMNGLIRNFDLAGDKCNPVFNFMPCCKPYQLKDWSHNWNVTYTKGYDGLYLPMAYVMRNLKLTESQASLLNKAYLASKVPNYIRFIGFPFVGLIVITILLASIYRKRIIQKMRQLTETPDMDSV